ncbi:toll/interleukin-1 receptor domain-containing protein [Dyella mobilis]|uniref:Toll/interleukin-1 receptor domain-containing protein n=1 Tax=Dyella mobilis TaxID=1849582 RepID=A0ABS2KEW4_9GAMM|nr:toll/interleukin-1 receptor domain-containing protein [Dyella mobilis]MBM7129400.1 toll/interleukin-1 receptor domain-containing protein [Dyella mobilis]GLQ98335.1 molecular chaperone Tir [Dyella mobilis]
MTAPKVFVSHASEDKERFAIPFATALRERGVDAWVDKWEMLPGDSLVDKIFEEGLKEAAAVVIILSNVSVSKPWVREELNAAVVNRISRGTKVIPVVLDSCEVPQALRSLVWEPVKDVRNFNECLGRVVDSIFGHKTKPALGKAPSYATATSLPQINGMTRADAAALQLLFEKYSADCHNSFIDANTITEASTRYGIGTELLSESFEILASQHLAEIIHYLGPGPYPTRITTYGISKVLGSEEGPLIRKVGFAILNDNAKDGATIARVAELSRPLVEHAIHRLEDAGHIKVVRGLGGETLIFDTKATLRRILST